MFRAVLLVKTETIRQQAPSSDEKITSSFSFFLCLVLVLLKTFKHIMKYGTESLDLFFFALLCFDISPILIKIPSPTREIL